MARLVGCRAWLYSACRQHHTWFCLGVPKLRYKTRILRRLVRCQTRGDGGGAASHLGTLERRVEELDIASDCRTYARSGIAWRERTATAFCRRFDFGRH